MTCVISFTLFLISVIGYSHLSALNNERKLEESYNIWLQVKEQYGDSYQYVIPSGSWTGYSTSTTFTVMNGQVTQRSFQS